MQDHDTDEKQRDIPTGLMAVAAFAIALGLLLAGCTETQRNKPEEQTRTENTEETRDASEKETDKQDEIVVTGARPRRLTGTGDTHAYAPAPMPEASRIAPSYPTRQVPSEVDRERYEDVKPNTVIAVADQPISTFSVDVDTASYAVVRRYLNDGGLPPRDAVRVEEMVNYFDYAYPLPEDRERPFAMALEVMPTPWNKDTQLLRVGLKGYALEPEETPAVNLVLLLDVSGSMEAPNKLPLLKKAMALLVDTLDGDDSIAIAVYAGAAGVVLEPTSGDDKGKILSALEGLSAGGSTAGGRGIELAYKLAQRNFDPDKVNRVILATDGDFNVGITDPEKLEDFVARKRETGVYLTILGFGQGNLNDALMQTLVQAGNGQAAYIDTLREARKVLVDDVRATLFPIAKDVKIQVEFNPARIAEYRLIGYETRLLDKADFNNDKVDAGEVGSGHAVTALYEIAAVGSAGRLIDPPRYQGNAPETPQTEDPRGEYAFVRLRYKLPEEDESRLIETPVTGDLGETRLAQVSQEARFAAAVAAFAQFLRGDSHLKDMDLDQILDLAQGARGDDPYGYRAEFTQLIRMAQAAGALDTGGVSSEGGSKAP